MTIESFIFYLGAYLAVFGLAGFIVGFLVLIWGGDTDRFMRIAVTVLLIGAVLFFLGLATGGCSECLARARHCRC